MLFPAWISIASGQAAINQTRFHDMNSTIRIKLSIMMFLQFFVWGAWFTTLGLALSTNGLSDIIGDAYGAVPLAAIIAPWFLGDITDRYFNCEKTYNL